ncbi:MAG: hypothetical protein HRU69_01970 [Flammeovirgaceae bacterium]|nr:MAG: hypothetical protein HRU69_01970 [Flammeovirgaceae bacterium]
MITETRTHLHRIFSVLLTTFLFASTHHAAGQYDDMRILSYIVDPEAQELHFYWKDEYGVILENFQNLKDYVERKGKALVFATNGGMFKQDFSPLGLFIQNGKTGESGVPGFTGDHQKMDLAREKLANNRKSIFNYLRRQMQNIKPLRSCLVVTQHLHT